MDIDKLNAANDLVARRSRVEYAAKEFDRRREEFGIVQFNTDDVHPLLARAIAEAVRTAFATQITRFDTALENL